MGSYNVKEYAELCRVTPETVRRWCRSGKIACTIYSKKGGYRITTDPETKTAVTNPVMVKMCKRIKKLRLDAGILQRDIADYMGISIFMYSKYERGHYIMPVTMLMKMALYYGVSSDYILGLTNMP